MEFFEMDDFNTYEYGAEQNDDCNYVESIHIFSIKVDNPLKVSIFFDNFIYLYNY